MCARRRAYYAADPMTVAAVWLTFGHETVAEDCCVGRPRRPRRSAFRSRDNHFGSGVPGRNTSRDKDGNLNRLHRRRVDLKLPEAGRARTN